MNQEKYNLCMTDDLHSRHMRPRNLIVIGVNYHSYVYAREFVRSWSALPQVSHILIADSFSSSQERDRIRGLSVHEKTIIVELDNHGYGSALNAALRIASKIDLVEDSLVLLGNVDVMPISIELDPIQEGQIPQIDVLEGGRNRNPFLTVFQKKMLFMYKLAAKRKSPFLLAMAVYLNRFLSLFPGETWAVHGSFIALPGTLINKFDSTFSPDVFLYCEELFFAEKVETLGYRFQQYRIAVEHIGSVSTGPAIKRDKLKLFKNWCDSMNKYSEM